ncbi:hypothetical protein TL16_g01752 [Triparma laevis f. inornata]|uniref:Ankyrin n=1 Tax=Triparma laevis f. inornata TaxID=1714386 RepID=A0A9W6ZRT6_9STRA|nr:hypothetical protein TL16_g01752 [Triparma laevis f. inornata]
MSDDEEDLDAMMAAISIPDDCDFLNSIMVDGGEENEGRDAVLVGNKNNPFDDSDSESDPNFITNNSIPPIPTTQDKAIPTTTKARRSSTPTGNYASKLQTLKTYTFNPSTPLSSSQLALSKNLLSSLPSTSPLHALLLRTTNTGPPILLKGSLEKIGTSSLVKKTNVRELKQLETTSQMILIDLSVTPMLTLPQHTLQTTESEDTDTPPRSSTPTTVPSEAAPASSRNPFKKINNIFSRNNMKKRSSIINNLSSPQPKSEPADMLKLSSQLVPFKTLKDDDDGLIPNGFGIVTPGRCYIFKSSLTSNLPMLHNLSNPQTINKRSPQGYTPLHYSVIGNSSTSITLTLLDYGADVNSLDTVLCRTPIFYACEGHEEEIVRVLKANGAEVEGEDVKGRSLADVIVEGGEGSKAVDSILNLLTSSGLDLNKTNAETGSTCLHLAVEKSLPIMINLLVNWGAELTVRRESDGLTPLQVNCVMPFGDEGDTEDGELKMFDVECMRTLIGSGACPNLPVRRDGRKRGSVATREEGKEGGCLELLVKGREGEKLVEKDGVMVVGEQWCYKVFVGVMELLRSGARVSEEVSGGRGARSGATRLRRCHKYNEERV